MRVKRTLGGALGGGKPGGGGHVTVLALLAVLCSRRGQPLSIGALQRQPRALDDIVTAPAETGVLEDWRVHKLAVEAARVRVGNRAADWTRLVEHMPGVVGALDGRDPVAGLAGDALVGDVEEVREREAWDDVAAAGSDRGVALGAEQILFPAEVFLSNRHQGAKHRVMHRVGMVGRGPLIVVRGMALLAGLCRGEVGQLQGRLGGHGEGVFLFLRDTGVGNDHIRCRVCTSSTPVAAAQRQQQPPAHRLSRKTRIAS